MRQGKHREEDVRGGAAIECYGVGWIQRRKPYLKKKQCLSSVPARLFIYCHPKKAGGPKENGPAVGSATSALLLLAPDL